MAFGLGLGKSPSLFPCFESALLAGAPGGLPRLPLPRVAALPRLDRTVQPVVQLLPLRRAAQDVAELVAGEAHEFLQVLGLVEQRVHVLRGDAGQLQEEVLQSVGICVVFLKCRYIVI